MEWSWHYKQRHENQCFDLNSSVGTEGSLYDKLWKWLERKIKDKGAMDYKAYESQWDHKDANRLDSIIYEMEGSRD